MGDVVDINVARKRRRQGGNIQRVGRALSGVIPVGQVAHVTAGDKSGYTLTCPVCDTTFSSVFLTCPTCTLGLPR